MPSPHASFLAVGTSFLFNFVRSSQAADCLPELRELSFVPGCKYAYACCVNRKGVAPRFQDLRKCKPGSQSASVCHARNLFALPELQLNQNGRVCRKLCVMTSTGLLVRSSRPLTVYYRLLRSEVTCGCGEKVAPSIRESGVHTRQGQCR